MARAGRNMGQDQAAREPPFLSHAWWTEPKGERGMGEQCSLRICNRVQAGKLCLVGGRTDGRQSNGQSSGQIIELHSRGDNQAQVLVRGFRVPAKERGKRRSTSPMLRLITTQEQSC